MRASALEFRLRYLLHGLVYTLGFLAPWDRLLPAGGPMNSGQSAWLTLASIPAREGLTSFSDATIALLVAGIVFSSTGAWLRTWGSAYLGAWIVKDGAMHGGHIVADGPYRHMRNPLYAGTWLHTLAVILLMPPTGALFTLTLITLIQARLIGAEESFLEGRFGPGYGAYRAAVPSILPALRARVAPGGRRPQWGAALLGEVYMIGVAGCFAVLGWRYNAFLLLKGLLVSLGVSLIARALLSPGGAEDRAKTPAMDHGA